MATASGYDNTLEIMLEHGANMNLKTRIEGDSVLHFAISYGAFRNRNVINILMKWGASLSLKNKCGDIPLEHCLFQFEKWHQSVHAVVLSTFKTFMFCQH